MHWLAQGLEGDEAVHAGLHFSLQDAANGIKADCAAGTFSFAGWILLQVHITCTFALAKENSARLGHTLFTHAAGDSSAKLKLFQEDELLQVCVHGLSAQSNLKCLNCLDQFFNPKAAAAVVLAVVARPFVHCSDFVLTDVFARTSPEFPSGSQRCCVRFDALT